MVTSDVFLNYIYGEKKEAKLYNRFSQGSSVKRGSDFKSSFFLHVRWGREAWACVKSYYKQLKT